MHGVVLRRALGAVPRLPLCLSLKVEHARLAGVAVADVRLLEVGVEDELVVVRRRRVDLLHALGGLVEDFSETHCGRGGESDGETEGGEGDGEMGGGAMGEVKVGMGGVEMLTGC